MRAVATTTTAASCSSRAKASTARKSKSEETHGRKKNESSAMTRTRREALTMILLSSSSSAAPLFAAQELEETVSEVAETIVVTPPSSDLSSSSSSKSSEPFGNKTFMEGIKDKDYGKSEVLYSDFTRTASGLQYKDVRPGSKEGKEYKDESKIAVVDWDGYTLGYYGRPFEARNGPKGGAFNEDKDFFRFRADDLDVLPAFREAIVGMKVGAIRRIIVPPNSGLAYPENKNWKKMKPKPNNFSGERALGFVLENQGMIDKTLLFDIELMDVR